MSKIDDELFKHYLTYIDKFQLEGLIHKNAEEFKQAIIDTNILKKDMNLNDFEYLFKIIEESHKLSLKSSIRIFKNLIFDYHVWLTGNYEVLPKKDY